jgi:hypothetical protein
MSKIVDLVTGRKAPIASLVPVLESHVAEARAALEALEAQRGELALAVVTKQPDATEAMAAFNTRLNAAREAVSNATAALATQTAKDAATLAEQKAVIRRNQVANVGKLLRDYLHEIEAYQTALMECEIHFREALRVGDEARDSATKSGWNWPAWASPGNFKRLTAALETEAFRIGSGPSGHLADHKWPLPGAKWHQELIAEWPDTKFSGRPMDFVPLLERQKFEIERVKQLLRNDAEAPIEAPVMPAAADDVTVAMARRSATDTSEQAEDGPRVITDIELVAAVQGAKHSLEAGVADAILTKHGMTDHEPRTVKPEHRLALFQAFEDAGKARLAEIKSAKAGASK